MQNIEEPMKKTYQAPSSNAVDITIEGPLMLSASSNVNNAGQGIRPGEDEFNGEFQSNKQGWNSDEWTDTEA